MSKKEVAINKVPVKGWVGGFSKSEKDFAYPNPKLLYDPTKNMLPFTHNMQYIDRIDRAIHVRWPEFSWCIEPKDEKTRCFVRFASDISRIGYSKEGRIYSIICPQLGAYTPLGSFNVEVTVNETRGWLNEDDMTDTFYGEIECVGQVWLAKPVKSDAKHYPHQKHLNDLIEHVKKHRPDHALPFSKKNSIKVKLLNSHNPSSKVLPVKVKPCPNFKPIPEATHYDESWQVGHLDVLIGDVVMTGDHMIDGFNQLLVDALNISKGNMLKKGHILTWNVWFTAPVLVNKEEWAEHAEKWRLSIDTDHGSPSELKAGAYYNMEGKKMNVTEALIKDSFEHTFAKIGEDVESGLKDFFHKRR